MTAHSRAWAVLVLSAFLSAGAAIAYAGARALNELRGVWDGSMTVAGWSAIIGACSLYLLAHLLRALRLVVMIQDERVGLRETFTAHFVAAGASLFIPFKLGEVFRIAEVARLLRSPVRALLLVWSERVLDLLAITGAMLVALIFRKDLFESTALGIFLTLAVVAGTFVALLVMPEQLESIKLLLIRRYRGAWSLGAVRAVDASQRLLMHAPDAMKRRPATLIALTAIIWTLEVASLALLLPAAAGALGATLSATAFFFSQLFPGSMGPLKSILERVMPNTAVSPPTAMYPAVLYIVFLVTSLMALLAALPTRLHEFLLTLRSRSLASLPAWMRRPAPTSALGDAS